MKVLDAAQCHQQPPGQTAFLKILKPQHGILIQVWIDYICTGNVGHDLIGSFYSDSILSRPVSKLGCQLLGRIEIKSKQLLLMVLSSGLVKVSSACSGDSHTKDSNCHFFCLHERWQLHWQDVLALELLTWPETDSCLHETEYMWYQVKPPRRKVNYQHFLTKTFMWKGHHKIDTFSLTIKVKTIFK